MKRTQRLKTILASILVTAALTTPAVVMSSARAPYNAELYFESDRLEVMADGSVQAIFNVSIDKLQNCFGAEFYLCYNRDYLTPSYISDQTDSVSGKAHTQNEPIVPVAIQDTDGFFAVDATLYGKQDAATQKLVNPFRQWNLNTGGMFAQNEFYSSITTIDEGSGRIHMKLRLDEGRLTYGVTDPIINKLGEGGKIRKLADFGQAGDEAIYAINLGDRAPEKVTLGQLSFRVNKEHLPEMVALFNGVGVPDGTENPYVTVSTTNADNTVTTKDIGLLYVPDEVGKDKDTWSMSAYVEDEGGFSADSGTYGPKGADAVHRNAEELYRFEFDGKTPVDVKLAEPEFTINAYQNYTDATENDIAISLGKYSPMAAVIYADGSQENVIVPWGQETVGGFATDYKPGLPAEMPTYDPTGSPQLAGGGHIPFTPSQKLVIHGKLFPVPVTAKMTVTHINLLDITAPDLERNYTVSKAYSEVKSGSALGLPTQARLITDVVPGGVSLVIPIPGWSPTEPGSAWPVLQPDKGNKSILMNSLKADGHDTATGLPNWPSDLDYQMGYISSAPDRFIGTYTFQLAERYGGAPKARFTRAEVWAKFPWLSAPLETQEPKIYELSEARRHIVSNEVFTDADLYKATYIETVTDQFNDEPTVRFMVERDGEGTAGSMSEDSVFRIWLPDGTELGTGLISRDIQATPQDFEIDDWFGDAVAAGSSGDEDGWYQKTPTTENTGKVKFTLETNTGDPLKHEYGDERETLRRYINLGGWFNITVCEDVENRTWSNPLPVYVEPRKNLYKENKVYNFLGENADLMKTPDPVGTTITMPHGTYTAVDKTGIPLYNDGSGNAVAVATDPLNRTTLERWEERYGLYTLYDGQTGAQPGVLYKFTLDTGTDTAWAPRSGGLTSANALNGPKAIRMYGDDDSGETDFKNKALYGGFGYVYQPGTGDAAKFGTVRLENDFMPKQEEEVTLTCDSISGITWNAPDVHGHVNVATATYDTVTEGYQTRQDYTFTITNVGDVDIYGLGIDGLTDGYPTDIPGGRFVMLQAPADFLAVGQSTTFVLTYVYDLPVNPATNPVYRDTLYITSDNHPTGGKHGGATGDYLLDFDALFTVTKSALHRVNLEVYPNEGTHNPTVPPEDPAYTNDPYPMGTAEVILGPQTALTPVTMDYTPATRNYPATSPVYILVDPKDEYVLDSIVCIDSSGNSVAIPAYGKLPSGENDPNAAKLDGRKEVYWIEMPDSDVTVIVRFREDLLSKLRLEDLIDFSAATRDQLKLTNEDREGGVPDEPHVDTVAEANTYRVWRKSYSDDERKAAKKWSNDESSKPDEDFYLMTCGTAIPKSQGGQKFISTENQYLVVIPSSAELSQVEATLRRIVVDHNGMAISATDDQLQENRDIHVEVDMDRYDGLENVVDSNKPPQKVYLPTAGFTGGPDPNDPDSRSVHTSQVFDSPAPGTSCYVRIRVSAKETEDGAQTTTTTQYRSYYLEIRVKPDKPDADLNYGNSPYGMIMNAGKFISLHENGTRNEDATAANRENAKKSFRDNGYSFNGLERTNVPNAAINKLDLVTYWREAWVKNGKLYEPESFTGQVQIVVTPSPSPSPSVSPSPSPSPSSSPNPNDPPEEEPVELEYYMVDDPNVYDVDENLDLNDFAFFAILGEDMREPGLLRALDSSGRPVDLKKVRVSAEVTLLDMTQDTQLGRFSGTETVTLDLGWAASHTYNIAGTATDPNNGKQNWPVSSVVSTNEDGEEERTYSLVEHIRPGRYKLVYTYADFDGESTLSVSRDFVILSRVGDVNVDLIRDNGGYGITDANYRLSDEYVLENRVTDPLGYDAQWLRPRTVTLPEGGTTTVDIYPYANIFKYRVCDVNNDRNVNNIDGNQINLNVRINANADNGSDAFLRFYDPVNYGLHE